MILPTLLIPSNFLLTLAAVAATTMLVMITIVLWPNEKKVPTVTGLCPLAISLRVIRSAHTVLSAIVT